MEAFKKNAVQMELPAEWLYGNPHNPFRVVDDAQMEERAESIHRLGVLTPLMVRPTGQSGEYEIISGHRRLYACKKVGVERIPVIVCPVDADAASVALVDSNLHRENLLPSEKAFAYRLKMEALSRQGQRRDPTSRQVVGKSETADRIADSESGRQVQRYIRLTYLVPEILQMVDERKIAFTPAVEISYLTTQEQTDLLSTIESEGCTPSLSQAQMLKQLSRMGELTADRILLVMAQPKANQRERISFRSEDLRSYFPPDYTIGQIHVMLQKLLSEYRRSWQTRERDGQHEK